MNNITKIEDPSPSKFRLQAIIVAAVLIVLGILVFFLASQVAGGVIALLGSIFGLGSQVARDAHLD